jgi:hypothetical protein
MNEKNKLIGKMEQTPIIEITAGKAIERDPPIEIAFTLTDALDIKYLWKICSLLEKRGYDSDKLELICKSHKSQFCGYDKRGNFISKNETAYSLAYNNIDDKTKDEIKGMLKSIPYVKIKKII